MQSLAPSEFFEGIKFNYSFYTTGDTKVTLEYVNNNFLKCTGYAYSRAISTSFNGIIYALGGIETTDITASGTISANLFQGSGVQLTNLNASNISDGTLAVARGGTGLSTLALGQLLIGNDTNPITQSANLIWDITNNNLGIGKNPEQKLDVNGTIAATLFSGSGASLTGLTEGQIPVLTAAKIPDLDAVKITAGTIANARLPAAISVTSFAGDGANITAINASNVGTGTIANARLPAAISVTSFAGDGASITAINASNIATGTIANARLPTDISVNSFTGSGASITNVNASNIATGTIDNACIALTTTKVFQHFHDKTFAVIDEKIDIPPTYSFNITSYDNPYLYGPSIDKKFKGKINASYDDRYGVYKLVSTDITKTNNTMVLNYKVGDKISIRNLADTKNDYVLDGNFKYYMSMVLYKRPSNLFWVNYPDTNFIQMIEWKSTSGTYPMLDPYLIDYRSGTEVNYPISTIISFTMEAGWSYYLMRFWIEITNPLPLIYPLGTEQNNYNQADGGGQTFKFQSGNISLNTNYVPAFSYTGPAYTTATSFQPGLVKPKLRMSVDDEGGISADAPTTTEIYGKLNTSHFTNNVATGKIDISTNLAELKGPKGDTGKGWTGATYSATTGIVSFTSGDALGFDTGDLRGGKGDKGDKGDDGDNGTNGKGWTGATYSATTGKVSFTSTDGTPYVFDTGDLRGGTGATGKGWTDASYNSTTGIVTFASNDALGFTTGDLRGGKGDKGDNGTNGKGWTSGSYAAATGIVLFASNDAGYAFTTGDLRGGAGTNGKGWTSGSYAAATGIVSFASNDAGYAFTTGDLRGGAGANGKGWTSGSYNATTGVVSFSSNDAGYAFTTGDLRGASGSTLTSTQLAALMNTTDHFTLNGTTSKIDFKTTYKIPTAATADAVAYSGITGIPTSWTDAQIPALAISKITGLQTALDGKALTSHTHTIAQITGLQTALDAKQSDINSTVGQLIIGNGNGATTTSTGLTWTTASNLLTATNLTVSGASTHTGTSILTGNVRIGGTGTTTAANVLQVGTGGRLRISNGTTDYTLIGTIDVDGTTNTQIIISGNTRTGNAGNIQYLATAGSHLFYTTATSIRMTISSTGVNVNNDLGASGNVGFGVAPSATYKLNVNGSQFINNQLKFSTRFTDLDNFPCNKINLINGSGYGFGIFTSTLEYFSVFNHRFYTGSTSASFGTERLFIDDSAGAVYINNINVDNGYAKLVVSGSDGNGVSAYFYHPNRTQGIGISYDGLRALGSSVNQNIVMRTRGTGTFQVEATGMAVNNYIVAGQHILSSSYIVSSNGYDATLLGDGGGMYLKFGDVGTQNNTYLEISASGGSTNFNSGSARVIYVRCNGYRWVCANVGEAFNAYNSSTWTVPSDHRIKENIKKSNLNICYDNVKNINLYRFNYIDGFNKGTQHDKTQLGFIAQQVQQHFPKSVSRRKMRIEDNRELPDFASVNIDQINFTLFGAVKKLIKVVEKQSKRIKKLEELLNIIDDDEVDNDADEPYERIVCDEVDIDTIEPSEPEGV